MKKSKAIKIALEIMEECKKKPNDCMGCPYVVKNGKFKGECMVSEPTFGAPSHWLLNELLGEDII